MHHSFELEDRKSKIRQSETKFKYNTCFQTNMVF